MLKQENKFIPWVEAWVFLERKRFTISVGKIRSRESLELNAWLYEQRIIVDHLLIVILCEAILNVIAAIVDATCADIATGTLQLMCTALHLGPVLGVQSLCHLLNALCQWHDLQAREHRDEELLLSAQILNGLDKVNRLRDIQVNHAHNINLLARRIHNLFASLSAVIHLSY